MIRPGILIRGKITPTINLKGKTNASIIREYPELENVEIKPTTEEQILKSEKYGFDEVKILGVTAEIDENIKSENIKAGVSILDVEGGYEGIDTSDATALAEDILQEKTAYVNNEKIIGTMQEYDGSYTGNGEIGNEWEEILKSCIDNTYGSKVTKLPEGITEIGNYAFQYCTYLALKELPESVTSIGETAFGYCTNLKLTKLPSKLTYIGKNAFMQCNKLNINEIPAGVTMINTYAFGYCKGLISLTILGDITEFGGQVFYNSSYLEKVTMPNITSVPVLGNSVFSNTRIGSKKGYIYVPDNLVEEIKVAENWSIYASQIKPISELEV